MIGEDGAGVDIIGEETEVEIERGGVPEVAPPGGEGLGAGALVCGEEGDDFFEHSVGQVADAVHQFFLSSGRWLMAALRGHGWFWPFGSVDSAATGDGAASWSSDAASFNLLALGPAGSISVPSGAPPSRVYGGAGRQELRQPDSSQRKKLKKD